MSVLIKGGRILTAADDYVGDVYVEGERISVIGESLDVQADKVIDTAGNYALTGCGDPHTHLDLPFRGATTIDDVKPCQTDAASRVTAYHAHFNIMPPAAATAALM